MTERFEAAVIGAGPAGSAAATTLAQAGRRVLLLEKEQFPRPKVCGEFLSSDALGFLERLAVRETVERSSPERIVRGRVYTPRGCAVSFRLPADALGISRFRLDDLLARHAGKAGADLRFGARVVSVEGPGASGFRIRFVDGQKEQEIESRVVIGAWGGWDALDRTLERGFQDRGIRFFGWSREYRGDTSALQGEVRLYLFPGGYCGLSRVEGGAANLAGVISERARRGLGALWSGVLEHVRRANPSLDADLSRLEPPGQGFLGTGPVFFTRKPPTERGMLMAGDAAGVIDPFSGEGQAAALASGILAAETALQRLRGELGHRDSLQAYENAWRGQFAKRFAWSAVFRRMILSPTLGRVAARLAGERLVRFATGALSR